MGKTFAFAVAVNAAVFGVALLFGADFVVAVAAGLGAQLLFT